MIVNWNDPRNSKQIQPLMGFPIYIALIQNLSAGSNPTIKPKVFKQTKSQALTGKTRCIFEFCLRTKLKMNTIKNWKKLTLKQNYDFHKGFGKKVIISTNYIIILKISHM